jgi:hypothetical protein
MSSTYLALRGSDEKEHLLSCGEEPHTKKSARVPLEGLIDLRKRLSRRDTDERFHLSTAQDEVKNSTKSSMR